MQTGKFDRQSLVASRHERKVRAPQGRMLDNVQSARAEGSGPQKWTADDLYSPELVSGRETGKDGTVV